MADELQTIFKSPMKIALFTIGLCLTLVIFLIGLNGKLELGYFLVAASMILASALWKAEEYSERQLVVMQKVYGIVGAYPITMEALVDRITDDNNTEFRSLYLSTIGLMLVKRMIVMRDGLVTLE